MTASSNPLAASVGWSVVVTLAPAAPGTFLDLVINGQEFTASPDELGEAMPGLDISKLPEEELMARRGW